MDQIALCLFSLIVVGAKSRNASQRIAIGIAYVSVYLIHAAFNHFYIHPLLQTVGILIVLPLIFVLIFRRNEKQLHRWLEIEFSSEIELLQMIHKGRFSDTRAGAYLASLKTRFAPEPIVDMYCYIQLYLELSIKAKRNVLLKESGFPPLIRMNYRDLWKLNQFRELVYSSNTPKLIQISFQEPLDG